MNRLKQLRKRGQAFWLDALDRDLIRTGGLQRLVNEDGLSGVSRNPKTFLKLVSGSDAYDEDLREALVQNPGASDRELYEQLAVADIRAAADTLRRVYDESDGVDGFVSLEVSPHLAYDTAETVKAVERLWEVVNRPNVMIEIPATSAGLPAIERCVAVGININSTLIFSLIQYEAVAQAYLRALQESPIQSRAASVASVFVSRIDRRVDAELDALGAPETEALKGKIAIAQAKLIYERFGELFSTEPFVELKQRGARVQRVVWASTRTKGPGDSDVRYVEELIGPDTVNTMPLETLDAFRDHGTVRGATLPDGLDQAKERLRTLAELGIDLEEITEELQIDGVDGFQQSFDQLLAALADKRRMIESSQVA